MNKSYLSTHGTEEKELVVEQRAILCRETQLKERLPAVMETH
jgi:hypothetical protein